MAINPPQIRSCEVGCIPVDKKQHRERGLPASVIQTKDLCVHSVSLSAFSTLENNEERWQQHLLHSSTNCCFRLFNRETQFPSFVGGCSASTPTAG